MFLRFWRKRGKIINPTTFRWNFRSPEQPSGAESGNDLKNTAAPELNPRCGGRTIQAI